MSGAVFVTGCSSGIGRALCTEFIRRGRRVFATARNRETLEDLEGPECRTTALDVTDRASVEAAVDNAAQWAGAIDILVNNAGWGLMGPVAELEADDLLSQLETNVVGPVSMIRAVVPGMAARHSGLIVNVGSVSGVTATPFAGAYCASKAALHALTDSLRMELKPFGISVISLQPGAVASNFGHSASTGLERYADETSLYRRMSDAIAARAQISQEGGMGAEDFARRVVAELLTDDPRPVIRLGPHSRRLPFLARLPIGIRDRIFAKKFGLDRLEG